MELTKEILEQEIKPGEIFKDVTTRIQRFHEPFRETLRFICKRGDDPQYVSWAIYCHRPENSALWIASWGDKVHSKDIIQSICPCTDEAFALYRS